MKILISKILFIFLLFWVFWVFLIQTTQAANDPPPCPCWSWTEHQCISGCGGKVQQRTCWGGCCAGCGPWITIKDCQSWQQCDGTLTCYCHGPCIETPQNPRYYDNPTYSDQPDKNKGSENVFLPVKLDWDDVKSWKQEDGSQSYVITMERTKRHGFVNREFKKIDIIPPEIIIPHPGEVLTKSEYNVLEKRGSCFLESGADYQWQVRACCNPNGTNCGPSSNWEFNTNLAPELKTPLDPDWAGEKYKTEERLTTTLSWCESDFRLVHREQPISFKLNVFKVVEGQYIPHPDLRTVRNGYRVQILRPRTYGGIEGRHYHPHYFRNEVYGLFTIDNLYAWRIAACRDRHARNCTDFSQKWRFQIDDTLQPPILLAPPNNRDIPVSLPILLQWKNQLGAKSFIYHIYQGNNRIINDVTTSPNVSLDHPQLTLNTLYNWRIMPCWDERGRNCETNAWSEKSYFKTTGRPPSPETMKPTGTDIPIPTFFEWEAVPGARSYVFKIQGTNLNRELIIEEPKTFLAFPDLLQETQYSWQVKTCARPMGGLCGEWSSSQVFTTFKLEIPTELIVSPHKDNNPGTIFTGDLHTFSWKLHASHHQFNLTYQRVEGEEREKCIELEQKEKTKILTNNSFFRPLECRGNYQWQVRGCLDRECTEAGVGVWSNPQNITLIARVAEPGAIRGGLIPCGRMFDNLNTPWVETDRCQFKHIFIMFYLILNFFLWTILPLALVVLVVYSGAIFYFSLSTESDEALPKVRALWRSTGIGFGVIFFAWTFISWALTLLNYQVGIFGPWWQI